MLTDVVRYLRLPMLRSTPVFGSRRPIGLEPVARTALDGAGTARPSSAPAVRMALLFSALSLCWQMPAASAGNIYKYVDRYGNVTYTDRKAGPGYKVLDFTTKGWINRLDSSANLAYARRNREKYRALVSDASTSFDLSPALLHAVITVESAYNHRAVSPAGAMGLMQLMPGTADRYGVRDAFDPRENIRGGCAYLRHLMGLFDGDLKLVLAAYNAGEGAVQKYNLSIPPYRETQDYVRKVLEHYQLLLKQA